MLSNKEELLKRGELLKIGSKFKRYSAMITTWEEAKDQSDLIKDVLDECPTVTVLVPKDIDHFIASYVYADIVDVWRRPINEHKVDYVPGLKPRQRTVENLESEVMAYKKRLKSMYDSSSSKKIKLLELGFNDSIDGISEKILDKRFSSNSDLMVEPVIHQKNINELASMDELESARKMLFDLKRDFRYFLALS